MAGADGDSRFVEDRAQVVRVYPLEREREDRGPLRCGTNEPDAGDGGKPLSGQGQQLGLMRHNGLRAERLHERDRLGEPDRFGDRWRSGLELHWHVGPRGALDGDRTDHPAADLPGRHLFEQLLATIQHADASGSEQLVARESQEVATQGMHVDDTVCH